ncbi:MAG: hypothetical protein EOP22_03455 [Hyphomicrobiales bacterium]|nr:MAG: hypothetical protein EOP22_03455 [Hyphomicrobiales bacterium]
MKPTPPPGQTVRKRSVARTLSLAAAWLFGVPLALVAVLYVALLIHPIPLPFISNQIRNLVLASMPPDSELELGDMALALEGYAWPVIQFSPVVFKDNATGGKVKMEAFEVGFSPIRSLIGQPGATVTLVGPHIQLNQDLFGPRLAEFEVIPDPAGGPATVRILEGSTAFPNAGFQRDGISVTGETTELTHVRSDNDWLVFNLEAAQLGIASVIEQSDLGRFSRLIIKGATVDMNDALYGSLRTFTNITLDIAPTPDGRAVEGNFSANFDGTIMRGIFERLIDENGEARLKMSLNNFALAAFAPLIDDTASAGGIVGPAAVSLDLGFDAVTGKIKEGVIHADMTGTDLRMGDDYYPIASNIIEIDWQPASGTFNMAESTMTIGDVTTKLSGVFVMGLDELYGPTVAISMQGKEITLKENGAPVTLFDNVSFQGWSAPIYGAVGIDRTVISREDGARIEARGRIDMLRKGLGFDMALAGKGITAADIRRVWPATAAPEARDWFAKNVLDGVIESATMKFAFPVGTLPVAGENKPIPQNGVFIEMVADGVRVNAVDGMAPIDILGKTRLQMHDSDITMAADGGVIQTDNGNITVANAALVMSPQSADENLVELSGDVSGGIPAVAAVLKQFAPDMMSSESVPIDLNALTGSLNLRLVTTTTLDGAGAMKSTDYSVNGNVAGLGTSEEIQGYKLGNGELSFMATQAGFRVGGSAEINGMGTDIAVDGDLSTGAATPPMTITAAANLEDLAKLGFDTGDFGKGRVAVTAVPRADGAIDIAADLKAASLTIKDLGITKDAGQAGMVKATVKQTGDLTDISALDLGFGSVKLKGSMQIDAKKGLQSAEFSNFAVSEGDAAQLSMTPVQGGYAVRIRGDQLDLKPVLTRFFNLNTGSGGPQATSFNDTIALDIELKRALGMYKTNAFNLDIDLALKGTDLRNVTMQGQIGSNGQVSVATNPVEGGRSMTVVFNDLGSVLRFVGVYPQLQGGEGSFVLATNTSTKVSNGAVNLKNFAIVDEKNLTALVNGHPDSRRALSGGNSMVFDSAKADFVQRADRIQIVDAVVTGDSIGGSGEGFIYTDKKQYDLVGTFVPMYGINNAFGKLFGGGNTGMWGITFAVNGPLDKPAFKVNPLSLLAPGAFRSLFEYRAKEQPRVD